MIVCCRGVDCTDCISPCDKHVGVHLKRIMGYFYRSALNKNKAVWRSGNLSSSQRRMLMAQWAAAAWTGLQTKEGLLKSAFVSTGFLLAKDGSEDHLIHLAGIANYTFRP